MTTVISFAPLGIESSCVRVAWTVEPPTPLYKQTQFTLDFGDALDPRSVPLKMWWTHILLCVHSHWNLIRPCRIVLPITLSDAEIEFWLRLLDHERVSLEAYRGTRDLARTIEIECRGNALADGELPPPVERFATAFSGGKESLLQTALLSEFTSCPLLVNTQSEMPPMFDHSTLRRARALQAIQARRDVELVVVKSDLRSSWENLYPRQLGYLQTVNEISDAYLYLANVFVVAAARGIRNLCLGAEREGQRGGMIWDGKPGQFYFMMSAPILLALDKYFRTLGLHFYSLLWGLSHFLDTKILWQRYGDIADLQNSCYGSPSSEVGYCSRCVKCRKIAFMLMGLDIDPARLEIDVTNLFLKGDEWDPKLSPTWGAMTYVARRLDLARIRKFFPPTNFLQQIRLQDAPAFRAFKLSVEILRAKDEAWAGQYHGAFGKYLPPELAARLEAIYRAYAPDPTVPDNDAEIALTDATVDWITAPLIQTA